MRKIIIINGSAGAGKDTFVEYFKTHSPVDVLEWSTVDSIKEIAYQFGWDGQKDHAGRRLLSDLKDAWTRYNDGSFKEITDQIEFSGDNYIAFIYVREPPEIEKFKNRYQDQCKTILIKRSGLEVPENRADQGVNGYKYDYVIENTTLDDLEYTARVMVLNWCGRLKVAT